VLKDDCLNPKFKTIQVVKYKYKPEYLQNFPEDERQKMGQYQTGILAQVNTRQGY